MCEWVDAGPQAAGFEPAGWTTPFIQEPIRRQFQVLYDRYYVAELLRNLGYSPDYNPIEYLWRKTKKRATHDKYFEQFAEVITSVERALGHFACHAEAVLALWQVLRRGRIGRSGSSFE